QMRVAGYFDEIAFLPLNLRGNLGEGIFGAIVQDGLPGTKTNFGVVDLLIVIDVPDRVAQLRSLIAGLLGKLIGLVGGVVGRGRGLARLAGGCFSVVDSGLGAGIHILNVAGVLRLELIELVQTVLNGIELPMYPLFAGEGIHMSPEAFVGFDGQRLAGGIGAVVA